MKRKFAVAFPAMMVVFIMIAAPAMAADDYGTQVAQKFGRGLGNAATGWIEIPKNIVNVTRDSNIALGLTWGILKGAMNTVGRTVVGALDLAFFFVPTREYVHPTFVWDPFDKDTTYGPQ